MRKTLLMWACTGACVGFGLLASAAYALRMRRAALRLGVWCLEAAVECAELAETKEPT